MTTKQVVFDDRDLDRFRYKGFWFLEGSYNASRIGETGTLSSTSDINANVTFTFPTPASAFSYYAIPRCCGGLYAICVDCDPVRPNWITIDAVVPNDDGQNPPIALYTQKFDKPGIHEIILRNQNDTRFGKSQITLDRFELTVPDNTPQPSVIPTQSSRTGSTAVPVGATATNKSGTNVAMIAGIAVGAVVLILAIFGLFLYRRKERRRRTALLDGPPPMEYSYAPRVSPSPMPTYLASAPSMRSTSLSGYGRGWDSSAPSASGSSSAGTNPSTRTGISRGPRREMDAGRVEEGEEEDGPTLPPEYGQVFGGRRSTGAAPLLANAAGPASEATSQSLSDMDRKVRLGPGAF